MFKERLVENRIQSIRNILTDLNALLRNTEAYYQNFIRYSISTKPPWEGSHLVYNVNTNFFQYWRPTPAEREEIEVISLKHYTYKHNACAKERHFIYYPCGYEYIAIVDDISWLRDIYSMVGWNKEHVKLQSDMYGTKLFQHVQTEANLEREKMKELLTYTNSIKPNKLF